MRIAITGGRGYVGRAVVAAALLRGHTVVSIDRPSVPADGQARDRRVTSMAADARSHGELQAAVDGCDALIHLAAHPSPRDRPGHEVHNDNVAASYNALSVAVAAGISRVCLASSVNAISGEFSRRARYDYLPVDEHHPTYAEDPYSLSKWICEQQADAFARRHDDLTIATLRLHWVVPAAVARPVREPPETAARQLWGYTDIEAAARACLLALTAPFSGHERFYVVAEDTHSPVSSDELHRRFYPDVPLRAPVDGHRGFFDCRKAERVLGWRHDAPGTAHESRKEVTR